MYVPDVFVGEHVCVWEGRGEFFEKHKQQAETGR